MPQQHSDGSGGLRLDPSSRWALQSRLDAIPDGLWTQCPQCREFLFKRALERNLKVCQGCEYHFRLTPRERIRLLLDEGSFTERDANLHATRLNEAVVTGQGMLNALPITIGVTDCRALMGQGWMAAAAGERLTRAVERAVELEIPMLFVSGSSDGGARRDGGVLALVQMAKSGGALARLRQAGLIAIVLLTDATTAGVLSSWGSLGDVILAEPGAMIERAGQELYPRVPVVQRPADFRTAEFLLKHGMIDKIVPRRELKTTLSRLLLFSAAGRESRKDSADESYQPSDLPDVARLPRSGDRHCREPGGSAGRARPGVRT